MAEEAAWAARPSNVIITCKWATCRSHPFQDKRYGVGHRVANKTNMKKGGYRCTVCGEVRMVGEIT